MVEVDGVTGLDFKQAREIILGKQGTTVDLTFRRQSQTYRVTLMRGNSGFIQVGSAVISVEETIRQPIWLPRIARLLDRLP
jgi:C-terminal processing protease CtpA/Prc